ncbi:MAG: RNA polymerase sigma-70 factor [Tannerellaceae bacterium]|jgi:RNA polymerase sigma-70 factor (ECF subfamily)|nr:RNA polymerase sigma-70 factor [Tannerellaceae bacterium]
MGAFTTEEFERSFKELYRPLCLFALRFVSQADDAEDVVQQTFADLWDKHTGMNRILNLKAYLFRSVRNRSLSVLAKAGEIPLEDAFPDAEDRSLEESMYDAERNARLWNEIDRLPPGRKKIFLLSKRDGLTYREIADELNLSVKTVESQIGKALKTLRETAVRIYTFFFG